MKQHNPIEHFELHPLIEIKLFGIDVSVNKAVIMMWIICILIPCIFMLAVKGRRIIPTRLQSLAEVCIEFLKNMVVENMGKEGLKFFPFIATLFFFILFCNLLGKIPGAYTVTSQIIVTGLFAIIVFIISQIVGLIKHGLKYLKIFVPEGVPKFILPLIVPVEIVSMIFRPISLSVRLFANMTAGHTILIVFFSMAISLKYIGFIPFLVTVPLNGLEIFIAFIQAYIFTILTCVYIGEAIKMH
ncbi:MAG: ATP synthase subunit A [Candidatus Scalindua rubra]|uniref:ATP synthase subunit a n=1 Tax=Candidatus Scalindua rubra TaxID=1872076 RepID=A0A1E3X6H3_9BACT|nr:MAG: ATP synthase subunit A [Candidatus Scalindua rubra]